MSPAVQTVIVALLVVGAIAFVVWRLMGAFRARSGKPGCPSCAAGDRCDDKPGAAAPRSDVQPLLLVKPGSRRS
jgi:hypothetical protein